MNNLHLVFGQFAYSLLFNSNYFDTKISQIIYFEDNLSLGPLGKFIPTNSGASRLAWLQKKLQKLAYAEPIVAAVKRDLEKLTAIPQIIPQFGRIYLWTGQKASEVIGTARFLSELSLSSADVFMLNLSGFSFSNKSGGVVYPKSLVEIAPADISRAFEQFEAMAGSDLAKWQKLWQEVCLQGGEIKVLNENGGVECADETYFDKALLANCNSKFKIAAQLIGETLVDINFTTSDWFLHLRLNQFAAWEQIETRGQLEDMCSFEVKLP